MKREELAIRLEEEGIPHHYYSLEGSLPNEKWCLQRTYAGWEVYYSEKGLKSQLRLFASEDEACDYLYKELKELVRFEGRRRDKPSR